MANIKSAGSLERREEVILTIPRAEVAQFRLGSARVLEMPVANTANHMPAVESPLYFDWLRPAGEKTYT